MPSIVGVGSALPANYYAQAELAQALQSLGPHRKRFDAERVAKLFAAVKVEGRHLALPLPRYAELAGFEERNREWLRVGLELSERAVRECLDSAGLVPGDVQLFAS